MRDLQRGIFSKKIELAQRGSVTNGATPLSSNTWTDRQCQQHHQQIPLVSFISIQVIQLETLNPIVNCEALATQLLFLHLKSVSRQEINQCFSF